MFRLRIREYQVGLWFRHGNFKRLLLPGSHFLPGRFFGGDLVQIVNTMNTVFSHSLLDFLVDEPTVREHLMVVDLRDGQRALVRKDGVLRWLLEPGRHAFWKRPYDITVEIYDVEDTLFEHPHLDAVLRLPEADKNLFSLLVQNNERALVFRDGALVGDLGPGRHVLWQQGNLTWKKVDLREQVADVAGQEIMTADKLTLRVNLLVTYRITDPLVAVTKVQDAAQALYREAQLALRAAIGQRTLDKLLSEKDATSTEILAAITERAAAFGIEVLSVGLRDLILPGEMKTILNQVLEAQKQAEANLIRRREETAAARNQANTAKLLAENPVLMRMKELEALQEILAGAKSTFVFGQGDLMDQVKGLAAGFESF